MGDMVDSVVGAFTGKAAKGSAPMNADIDYSAFNPNAQEQSLTDMLVARANGTVPSAAEQTMQNGIGQAQRAASATAAGARGVNPALAARLAEQQQSNLASQGIGQSAALRSQEQAAATTGAAGLMTDQRAGRAAGQQLNVQNVTGMNTINSNNANAGANRQSNLLSGLGGAAMIMASDENLKENVHSGGAKIQDFLDAISAEEYNYKDPHTAGAGHGSFVSPMAQDLEKTPIGAQMVQDTPQGKMVDYGKGMGAVLAAQAHLNERMNKMEGTQKLAYGGFASGVESAVQGTKNLIGSELKESKLPTPKPKGEEKPETSAAVASGTSVNTLGPAADLTTMMASDGAVVPGRAEVAGDSPKNDKVKALLSPGELIIPRSVVKGGPDAIRSFAEALLEEEKTA